MNLKTIFEKQKQLDLAFTEYTSKHGRINQENALWEDQVIIAAIVEIAEFANEIESFKYWKINKKNNTDKIIEEYADAIHFLTSASLHFQLDHNFQPKQVENYDINNQFKKVFVLSSEFLLHKDKDILKELINYFLGFIKILNWDEKIIFDAYDKKYRTNLERIKNNY
ncbi:dUTP diphosphatase [Mesomycoplasma conjunctivae]|uniref:dUTP diphosphatase n=1 Tax=Mesomycoplasma conjunctivae TaxID=45361 RepID=UPI003DA540F4